MSRIAKGTSKGSNWPLRILGVLAALNTEAIGGVLLYSYESDHMLALQYVGMSVTLVLLGFVVSGNAAANSADPREGVRKTAGPARLAAFLLILPSIGMGGASMALKMEVQAAQEYRNGSEFKGDLQNSTGKDQSGDILDSQVVAQANANLAKATVPKQVRMDDPAFIGGLVFFAFIHSLPLIAAGWGVTYTPETPAQTRARLTEERANRPKRKYNRRVNGKVVQLNRR